MPIFSDDARKLAPRVEIRPKTPNAKAADYARTMRVECTTTMLTAGPTPDSRRKFLYAPRSALGSRHAANMMSALADLLSISPAMRTGCRTHPSCDVAADPSAGDRPRDGDRKRRLTPNASHK